MDTSPASATPELFKVYEQPKLEHVLDLVVTCSGPLTFGPSSKSKEGERTRFWPIIGGRFRGPNISGRVIPGGADYPLVRPDGVLVIDAFYRLETDDGVSIVIHNKGFEIEPRADDGKRQFRLSPSFTTVEPYEWLNKGLFVATLVLDVPEQLKLAREGEDENDRLIQVFRVC